MVEPRPAVKGPQTVSRRLSVLLATALAGAALVTSPPARPIVSVAALD